MEANPRLWHISFEILSQINFFLLTSILGGNLISHICYEYFPFHICYETCEIIIIIIIIIIIDKL